VVFAIRLVQSRSAFFISSIAKIAFAVFPPKFFKLYPFFQETAKDTNAARL
jgi:hypothetical protein